MSALSNLYSETTSPYVGHWRLFSLYFLYASTFFQALVKADLTQTVVTAIIASDFDSSGTFSDQEIQILELRMKNVPGVTVRHDLLVQAASGSDRSMSNVLRLLDDIDREDLTDNERIFQFDETHLAQRESDAKTK